MGYSLRDGVSFCQVGKRTIFLDIWADRYFCLSEAAERSFMELVKDGVLQSDDKHVTALVARGLLIPSPGSHAPNGCELTPVPQASILEQQLPAPSLAGTTGALVQLINTRIRLKAAGLGRTLSSLSTRKARLPRSIVNSNAHVDGIMADFVSASRFTSLFEDCLPHSLAVASQLINQGTSPDIVVGVQLGPFCAHCWVQHDGKLVNDRFDMVRNFTPILVI